MDTKAKEQQKYYTTASKPRNGIHELLLSILFWNRATSTNLYWSRTISTNTAQEAY